MNTKLFFSLLLLFFSCTAISQDKMNVKFGDVSEKDFATKIYPIDSNASAVVIADYGTSRIEGNNKGWFSLVYKHYKRVHILNKNGYDIANVSIPVYNDGEDEEEVSKLKAVTYNLENGKVVESKLDTKSGVFKDKLSRNHAIKKFTFPNVKEGSIIEFEYTITSDFLQNLQPWEFQGAYPRLWSEYNLEVPEFFTYVFLTQGYKEYDIKDRTMKRDMFKVLESRGTSASDGVSFNANISDYRWVMKNVPALKEESYTSTIDNHIAKIEFQLSERREPLRYFNYMGTWPKLMEDLGKMELFGGQLDKDNNWIKEYIGNITGGTGSKLEKAQAIYRYVRDNYTSTRNDMIPDQPLKVVAKAKNGTAAEINMLLGAMLKYAGIEVEPVILSTRGHGYTYSLYPLITKFNYVIMRAKIDGQKYFLDATQPRLGFGYLPLKCYNGHARVVNSSAEVLELSSDLFTESKATTVFIINDDKGNLIGSLQETPGYYESLKLRDEIKEKGKEALEKELRKNFGADILLSNFVVDSLDQYENGIALKYDFDIVGEKEDIIYLSPMFGEALKENPFKSAKRIYPVEMPYAYDYVYNLQLEVPHGYVVDELPQSLVMKLNEQDEGLFEYRISQSGNNISLRCRTKLVRTYYLPEEYEMLREFFNMVVKKQSEQIVFKKKK